MILPKSCKKLGKNLVTHPGDILSGLLAISYKSFLLGICLYYIYIYKFLFNLQVLTLKMTFHLQQLSDLYIK